MQIGKLYFSFFRHYCNVISIRSALINFLHCLLYAIVLFAHCCLHYKAHYSISFLLFLCSDINITLPAFNRPRYEVSGLAASWSTIHGRSSSIVDGSPLLSIFHPMPVPSIIWCYPAKLSVAFLVLFYITWYPDNFLFQTVSGFSYNMTKETKFLWYYGLRETFLCLSLFHYPFIGSLMCPWDSQNLSETLHFKRSDILSPFLNVQLSHAYVATGHTQVRRRRTFVLTDVTFPYPIW